MLGSACDGAILRLVTVFCAQAAQESPPQKQKRENHCCSLEGEMVNERNKADDS